MSTTHTDCRSTWSEKRENGLVVPCVYHGCSSPSQVAKILKIELHKASALYKYVRIEVSETVITKKLVFRNENLKLRLVNFVYELENNFISLVPCQKQ